MSEPINLNLGSGNKPIPGWINLDIVQLPGVDVIHNFLNVPYPFTSGKFDRILCSHVMEHIPQVVNGTDGLLLVTKELHRILKPGGIIEVRGPHPRLGIHYFNNPTHYRVITEWTFDGLVGPRHDSCVAFSSDVRFSKMVVRSEKFTEPPFGWKIFESVMRRVPGAKRVLGRPAELVILLTK